MRIDRPALVLALLGLAGSAAAANTAKGTLTVKGQKLALSNVYAYAEAGTSDTGGADVVVILSNIAIPEASARDMFALREKVPQYLRLTISSEGQITSVRPQHGAFKNVMGGGSSDFVFEKTVLDGKSVSGRAFTKRPQRGFDDEPWEFDVTFETAVAPKK